MDTPISKKTEPAQAVSRYFIRLAYRGKNYHGWQRQPGAISVQETIEDALARVFRLSQLQVTGAGRTDAGVNASCMIAHFDLPDDRLINPAFLPRLLHSLNCMLAPDIVIYDIRKVRPQAHARFDAVSRTYHYYVHTLRDPFFRELSWLAPAELDFEAMNRAAEILLQTEDFTSFSKLHTDTKTNICHVTHAAWRPLAPHRWVFEITADRFLRNMVRAVVGTLVEVGRGKLTLDQFRDIIKRKDRCAAGTSMPGGPLFLHAIEYPY